MFSRSDYSLSKADAEVWAAMLAEDARQEAHIELIASENYASPAVMAAQGGQMTNKYAEGYPGNRYYGGCEVVDSVEELARSRAKALFGADHVNVQPHSGSQANEAVYRATCEVGDTVLETEWQGVIRVQDVRATEKDKVKIYESFKPGDIVRAQVVSFFLSS